MGQMDLLPTEFTNGRKRAWRKKESTEIEALPLEMKRKLEN